MANAFMPSALSSLNAAGQDSLEQIMKQRLFEQQMQQAQLQGQGQLNNFRLDLRQQDAQERYRDDMMRRYDNDRAAGLEEVRLKLGAETNEAQGKALALQQFIEARQRGDREGMLKYGQAAGLPLASLLREPETPRDPVAVAYETTKARNRANAEDRRAGILPTKVAKGAKPAKDNPKVPSGFLAAIEGRKGTAGFDSADNAIKSIEGRWGDWRKNYPSLDLNAVRAAVQNVYGQRLSGGNSGLDAIVGAAIEAAMKVQNDD